MPRGGPTASSIRGAKAGAVGGSVKRCVKGKSCSATCIDPREECLVELPLSVSQSLDQALSMVNGSRGRKRTVEKEPTVTQKGSALLKELQAEGKKEAAAPAPAPAPAPKGEKNKGPEPSSLKPLRKAAPEGGSWDGKFKGRSEALDAELDKLSKLVSKLPPEEQKFWNEQITKQMNPKLASRNGTPYPEEKTNKSLLSQARAWQYLIENGPPKELMNRIGEKRPAPAGMMPDVTSSGQRKWIAPDTGLKYSLNKGNWRQNRVSKLDTLRRLPALTEFRKNQRDNGEEWPIQKLPPRAGLPKTPEEVLKSLTKAEKNAIVFNGLDATGNEGVKLREYYNANPKEKEARLMEIVRRWHDQGGRSGASGQPVALPGLEPKPGEERSSVDHFQPISTNRAASLPAQDMRKIADNYKNFLITEEGPNSQRGARTWDSWLDKQESAQQK